MIIVPFLWFNTIIGIGKNRESVAIARVNIRAAGLENKIEIIEGDIFHLDKIAGKFDYVLAEAILTMQSPQGKAKMLTEVHNRLKPGGKFLSHELLANEKETEISTDLAKVIKVNSTPLSVIHWIQVFTQAGLQVQKYETAAMSLLSWWRMLQDEGIINTMQILWNILTKPPIRQPVLEMRQVFQQYQQELGYILLCGVIE